jgi:PAS domain S-box-containing protein
MKPKSLVKFPKLKFSKKAPKKAIDEPDHNIALESVPGLYLTLLPDKQFTIVAVSCSGKMCAAVNPSKLIGKGLFKALPQYADKTGIDKLTASLKRVTGLKEPDTMALQRYEKPLPNGGFEVVYWETTNTPVLDKNNNVKYIIHRISNVTEIVALKQKLHEKPEWTGKMESSGKNYADGVSENESMFHYLKQKHNNHAIFTLDKNGNVVTWNDGAEAINGYKAEEIIGKNFSVFYMEPEVVNHEPINNLGVAISQGRYEAERWRQHKDGSRYRAMVVITPLYNSMGSLAGFTSITQSLAKIENPISRTA